LTYTDKVGKPTFSFAIVYPDDGSRRRRKQSIACLITRHRCKRKVGNNVEH